MDIHTWDETAKVVAVFAGIVFGSVAISAASFVWLRRQVFAYGGSALCVSGVVLLGLSICRTVEFGVGPTGMSLKAAQQLAEAFAAAAQSAEEAVKAATSAVAAAKTGSGEGGKTFYFTQSGQDLDKAMQQAQAARLAAASPKGAAQMWLNMSPHASAPIAAGGDVVVPH